MSSLLILTFIIGTVIYLGGRIDLTFFEDNVEDTGQRDTTTTKY